jgi:thiamine biosynthesis lipoprotein
MVAEESQASRGTLSPMMLSRPLAFRIFLLFACALLHAPLGRAEVDVFHDQFLSLGTLIEISIRTDDTVLARKAFRVLEDDFAYWHVNWHAWNPGSLQRLNRRLPSGDCIAARDLIPLIERARAFSRTSRGLFDAAIGRLVELWGFHGGQGERKPPSAAAIARLVHRAPAMDDLEISGTCVRSGNPTVMLDLGGFAKGYAVDRAIETLKAMGITDAIVNAGGDVFAIGQHGKRPWSIGIRHPRAVGVIAWLEIRGGEAVFTSGDYERFFNYKNKRYQHILDPRDGYPVAETESVTVVHRYGDVADAAATALMVAGPSEWVEIAHKMDIDQAMLIDRAGRVYITPKLAERIHFVGIPAEKIIVER